MQGLTSPDARNQGHTQSQFWCNQVQSFRMTPFCQSFLPKMALYTHETVVMSYHMVLTKSVVITIEYFYVYYAYSYGCHCCVKEF